MTNDMTNDMKINALFKTMILDGVHSGIINKSNRQKALSAFKQFASSCYGNEEVNDFFKSYEMVFGAKVNEDYNVPQVNAQSNNIVSNKKDSNKVFKYSNDSQTNTPGWNWDTIGAKVGESLELRNHCKKIATLYVGDGFRGVCSSPNDNNVMHPCDLIRNRFSNENIDTSHIASHLFYRGKSIVSWMNKIKNRNNKKKGTKARLIASGIPVGEYITDRINNRSVLVCENDELEFNGERLTYWEYGQKHVSKTKKWSEFQEQECARKGTKTPPPISDNFIYRKKTLTWYFRQYHKALNNKTR